MLGTCIYFCFSYLAILAVLAILAMGPKNGPKAHQWLNRARNEAAVWLYQKTKENRAEGPQEAPCNG